jgi:hypothetical protein
LKIIFNVFFVFNSDLWIRRPIRRLPDLLNQIMFTIGVLNKEKEIKDEWLKIDKIEEINKKIRKIRKIEKISEILYLLSERKLKDIYEGEIKEGSVYIKELNFYSKIPNNSKEQLNEGDFYNFKIYLFQDEYLIKRKIRLQLH